MCQRVEQPSVLHRHRLELWVDGDDGAVVGDLDIALDELVVREVLPATACTLRFVADQRLEAVLRVTQLIGHLLLRLDRLICHSVREESFVNLQQGFFVVDEEVEQVTLVAVGEVGDLDSVFGQLSESQKTLFKLLGLLGTLLHLLELLAVVNFILKPSLHDLFPNLFDAVDKQCFQLVLFSCLVYLVCVNLLLMSTLSVNQRLKVSDGVRVACLECLDVLDDFLLDFKRLHL